MFRIPSLPMWLEPVMTFTLPCSSAVVPRISSAQPVMPQLHPLTLHRPHRACRNACHSIQLRYGDPSSSAGRGLRSFHHGHICVPTRADVACSQGWLAAWEEGAWWRRSINGTVGSNSPYRVIICFIAADSQIIETYIILEDSRKKLSPRSMSSSKRTHVEMQVISTLHYVCVMETQPRT